MKKIILTLVLALGFGFVSAQEKEDMAFGAKAGLNLANITNADGSSTLVGFHVGFFAEFMLGENFAVQPELLYSTQGAEFDDGDLKLDYITIPVMLKYYVADSFSLEIGPQVGFLVSAEEVGVDIKDDVKSTDFGVNFGAGYDVTPNLIIGVRYNLGLSRWQEALFPGESESENSVFQISLGYRF